MQATEWVIGVCARARASKGCAGVREGGGEGGCRRSRAGGPRGHGERRRRSRRGKAARALALALALMLETTTGTVAATED
jgi:hypothetical protein